LHPIRTLSTAIACSLLHAPSPAAAPYDNRFVSIVTIANHKVAHRRDYLDPIAVFDTVGWPGQPETL